MAEQEQPERLRPDRPVTVEDIRQLAGPATPHFALQIRSRIRRLIADLQPDDPARIEGERQIALLELLAHADEFRGEPPAPDLPPRPSLALDAVQPRGLPTPPL
jgi:hypothetical protein